MQTQPMTKFNQYRLAEVVDGLKGRMRKLTHIYFDKTLIATVASFVDGPDDKTLWNFHKPVAVTGMVPYGSTWMNMTTVAFTKLEQAIVHAVELYETCREGGPSAHEWQDRIYQHI